MSNIFLSSFNNYIPWGVLPLLGAQLGFFVTVFFFDVLLGEWTHSRRVVYTKSVPKGKAMPNWWSQLFLASWEMLGVSAVLNGAASHLLMTWRNAASPPVDLWLLPPTTTCLRDFVAMYVIGDLGLYLGHRLLHENDWLWRNCHRCV